MHGTVNDLICTRVALDACPLHYRARRGRCCYSLRLRALAAPPLRQRETPSLRARAHARSASSETERGCQHWPGLVAWPLLVLAGGSALGVAPAQDLGEKSPPSALTPQSEPLLAARLARGLGRPYTVSRVVVGPPGRTTLCVSLTSPRPHRGRSYFAVLARRGRPHSHTRRLTATRVTGTLLAWPGGVRT